jgi:putative transposase
MWTKAQRERHERLAGDYPSSLTDAEWAELERLVPPARPGGRPRETDMCAAMDALFYLLRTGCPWRYLPRGGHFPPRSTVYNIFRGFQRDGVWEAIAATLVEAERQRLGREPDPSACILDSQTARAAERGGPRADPVGYDAGKRTKGRKRHLLTDTLGLPLRVVVHSAGIQDRDGAALVLDGLRARCPHLGLVWADAGYLARKVNDAVADVAGLRIEIVKRSQPTGWHLLPRRWVIERTFAWFGRNRRLARDYEGIVDAALAFIHLATIQLIVRRQARP